MHEFQSHKKVHAAKITAIQNVDHKSVRIELGDEPHVLVDKLDVPEGLW